MTTDPLINIAIPTYNRAGCLGRAIEAALRQAYDRFTVTVVDDGSSDETWRVLEGFASDPRLCAIRLGRNVGTAQAKNVALLCSRYDAITFHDSDDVPDERKLLLQSRALATRCYAHPILDWASLGHTPGDVIEVDVVVGAYDLIKMDGAVFRIANRVSLVDDFFPNVQGPSKTPGDWCLINAGLFRRSVFERFGGYLDCIEEDRELRNRTIAGGCVYHFVDAPLLTKIEMSDSLTIAAETGYDGAQRVEDRGEVWRRVKALREGLRGAAVAEAQRVVLDLDEVIIADLIHPELLEVGAAIPATPRTHQRLARMLRSPGAARPTPRRAPAGVGAFASPQEEQP